jgi:MFS family permease
LSFTSVVLAFALYNTIYALGSYPLGKLSDRIGRKPIVCGGWLVYAGVYLGFAWNASTSAVWLLMAAYGLYQAMTEGVTKAMVSDLVPKDRRAGAIGLFYTVSGIGQLAASVLAGAIWDVRWFGSAMATFALGAVCAAGAAMLVLTIRSESSEAATSR